MLDYFPRVSAFTAVAAILWSSAALSGSSDPGDAGTQFKPLQSISFEFDSKFVNGSFVKKEAQCLVTIVVTQRGDPATPIPLTTARVRLALYPAQTAGFDSGEDNSLKYPGHVSSEQKQSLNFTCGDGANSLFVGHGEWETHLARQMQAARQEVAKAQ